MSLNSELGTGLPAAGEGGDAASVDDIAIDTAEPTFEPVAAPPAASAGDAAEESAGSGGGDAYAEGAPAGELGDVSFDNDPEDEEQSAFGNLFPKKKLANGLSEAGRLWGVLGSKVKETATKVSENPNVVAMKERSSETWGTVVEKTKAGVEKVKEVSAPVTSKVSAAAGVVAEKAKPVTEPIGRGVGAASAVVSEKAKNASESVRQSVTSEDFQFGRKTIGATLTSAAATTRETLSNAPANISVAAKNAGENIKSGVAGAKDAVTNLAARASTSGGEAAADAGGEAGAEGEVPPPVPAANPNPPITV
eukprot:CAMPEP_0182562780 /NCGR_PEP_ID=MMETSP1324-20130603/5069_1 /TAXON_ID=236786 /ORGANISM="Florenciella sp., Strain RCC1587" /LENGTH=307 /DNA_ID=CAMNT_0024775825 /DNA_START=106 /DNA_END=1029 /DNA_ORIENTATION=-